MVVVVTSVAIRSATNTVAYNKSVETLKQNHSNTDWEYEYLAMADVMFVPKREGRLLGMPCVVSSTYAQWKDLNEDTHRILVALRPKQQTRNDNDDPNQYFEYDCETDTSDQTTDDDVIFLLLKPPKDDNVSTRATHPLATCKVDACFQTNHGGILSASSLGITQHSADTFTLEDSNLGTLQMRHNYFQFQILNPREHQDEEGCGCCYDGTDMKKLLTRLAISAPPADTVQD